ncbi:MAG TPA: heavy-metal-associated domain-containing protein [Anaerolineales bacterium]|nr:heavy-metal-associated domain-containing protein [Anaerolineales bacterium]
MSVATYHVPNISCGHCVHTIETELGEVAGVRRVEVDQMQKRVEVEFDAPLTDERIRQALAEIDYAAD